MYIKKGMVEVQSVPPPSTWHIRCPSEKDLVVSTLYSNVHPSSPMVVVVVVVVLVGGVVRIRALGPTTIFFLFTLNLSMWL